MNIVGGLLVGKRDRQAILNLCDKVQGVMASKSRGIEIIIGGAGRLVT